MGQDLRKLPRWVKSCLALLLVVLSASVPTIIVASIALGFPTTPENLISRATALLGGTSRHEVLVVPSPTPGCDVSPEDSATVGGQFPVRGTGCILPDGPVYVLLKDAMAEGNYWIQCETRTSQNQFVCGAFACVDQAQYQVIIALPRSDLSRSEYSDWFQDQSNVGRKRLPYGDDVLLIGGARIVEAWHTTDSPPSPHCKDRVPEGYVAPVSNTPRSGEPDAAAASRTLRPTNTVTETVGSAPSSQTEPASPTTPSSDTPSPTDTVTPTPSPTDASPLQQPESYVTSDDALEPEPPGDDLALMFPQ